MTEHRYGDPSALRQALTDRLRQLVLGRPGAQLADLQRQFAYDRLLSRVFAFEPEAWVLKGATALLARLSGSARHTVDVDLYRRTAGLDEAEVALRAAASLDLGDFFRFEMSPGRHVAQGRAALRVPLIAYLGATEFARFHVDLVTGLAMTGEPDEVDPLVPFEIPGIDPVRYRAYPLADHVADKVCAFLELHPRGGRHCPGKHPLSRPGRSRPHRAHAVHRCRRAAPRARLRSSTPRARSAQRPAVAGGRRLASRVCTGRQGRAGAAGAGSRSCTGDSAPVRGSSARGEPCGHVGPGRADVVRLTAHRLGDRSAVGRPWSAVQAWIRRAQDPSARSATAAKPGH